MMMGTPGYLSPEQARGRNVDHRTDIYALGCMTFEIVCGRLPFIADNAMDIVLMHMTMPPPRASAVWPDIPQPLDELIARMLDKDPAVRPTLADVRAVFAELVTSGLVTLGNGRGIAFGSDLGRLNTPGGGLASPAIPKLALGTTPQLGGSNTQPPNAGTKKTGLVVALVAVVLVGGGAAALFALKADGSKPAAAPEVAESTQPATKVASPTPPAKEPAAPTPSPAPPPAPPAPDPSKPATITIAINIDNAEVTVDGKHVDVTGKSARVTVEEAGAHVVAIKAHGREPFEQTVETKPGEVAQVVAKLERVKQKPATTARTPTTKTQPSQGAGSGSATKPKQTLVDKNAPINPF
jgi:serine/threonine-protein kinase